MNDLTVPLSLPAVKTKDRCKLFCRVSESSAYYLLDERVKDGTTCTPDTDDMCVNGICVPAGCDHILHSSVHAGQYTLYTVP